MIRFRIKLDGVYKLFERQLHLIRMAKHLNKLFETLPYAIIWHTHYVCKQKNIKTTTFFIYKLQSVINTCTLKMSKTNAKRGTPLFCFILFSIHFFSNAGFALFLFCFWFGKNLTKQTRSDRLFSIDSERSFWESDVLEIYKSSYLIRYETGHYVIICRYGFPAK